MNVIVHMQLQTQMSNLKQADDMTLVAASWEDLKAILQSLDEKCQQMGLVFAKSFLSDNTYDNYVYAASL